MSCYACRIVLRVTGNACKLLLTVCSIDVTPSIIVIIDSVIDIVL